MRKAICPKCQKLIEVDETQPTFICPHCAANELSEAAMKDYYRTVNLCSRKAEIAVKASTDYIEAYKLYSKLNYLCDTDLNILMWTVLSRIYCSNLHEIYIKDATDILVKGSVKVEINKSNVLALGDSLNKIRLDIVKILEALAYRSLESTYGLNNYHKAINEYIYFLDTYNHIYDEMGELANAFKDNKEIINDELNRAKKLLEEKIEVKNNNDVKHDYYDNKGKVTIDIFPNMKKIYKIRMILTAVTIVGALTSFVGAILASTNVSGVAKIVTLSIGLPLFIGGYFVGHKLKSINLNLDY